MCLKEMNIPKPVKYGRISFVVFLICFLFKIRIAAHLIIFLPSSFSFYYFSDRIQGS